MATSSRSPQMLRGALVSVDTFSRAPNALLFQYNPDTLTRTLQTQGGGDHGARSEALRLGGAPIENIKLDIEFDATEPLEAGDSRATSMGVHPQLAALEMLVYPRSALVIANTVLMAAGTLEVIPPTAPFTLFIWGARRVLPVRIADFSITEEAYDNNLNPLRARVSLSLRVLSYSDLPLTDPGYSLFMAHQVVKEALATVAGAGNLTESLGGNTRLF